MTDKTSKRGRGDVPGLKILISAGALAATLSGWAVLGQRDAQAADGSGMATGDGGLPPELATLTAPLPTVVPPPAKVDVGIVAPAVLPTPMRTILRSVSIPPPVIVEASDGNSRSSR